MNFQHKTFFKVFGAILSFVLISGSVAFTFLNWRGILDFIAAKNYKPTSEITQIVQRIKPTDTGKTIFYASNPQVEDSAEFNGNCKSSEGDSAVLGCYRAEKIHVYNVVNTKLDGIKDVAAAHELLHAIWQRMSRDERIKIGNLLEAEYEKNKTPEFEKLMQSYEKTEPGEKINELHSLIGTEYANISKELESHYAKFFQNRKEIVQIYQGYDNNLKNLKNQAEKLSNELKAEKEQIEALNAKYSDDIKKINSDIANFNSNAKSGYYETQQAFNADRAKLLVRIQQIEAWRTAINNLVNNYNSKVEELNQVSIQQNELYKSMNSNLSSPSL